MIRLEWNALQIGHHVLVHDEADPGLPLVPGRVIEVQEARGSNEIAIRVPAGRGRSKIVRPPRLAVHLEELDPEARCWRCEIRLDERLRPRRKAPAPGAGT